mmetsp:Transcript_48646/g.77488  ORF Transcript_48646/g.77488 Transcript_48646/m.77488 type:complete len:90 (+) Transcript_48646:239-508(+)
MSCATAFKAVALAPFTPGSIGTIIDKKSHELGESPRAVKAKKFSRFVMVVNPRGLKFRSIQGVADRPVAVQSIPYATMKFLTCVTDHLR